MVEKHQIVLSFIMLITLKSKVKDVSGAHYLTWEMSLLYCYFVFAHVPENSPETQSADTSTTTPLLTQQQREILPHALVQDEKRKSHANNILLSVNIATAT